MKIYYWSPHTSYVATIKSVLNSALSLEKYGKNNFEVSIIDANGEWKDIESKKIKFIRLYNKIYFKTFEVHGYLISRLSYLYIFFFSFFSLKKLIKKDKPEFFFIQLISSLPLILIILFNFNTKFILRISGYPQLSFFRKIIWKLAAKKIHLIACPTQITLDLLKSQNIFDKNKLILLEDPIFSIREIVNLKKEKLEQNLDKNFKYLLSIGRLTRQKNFSLLIKGFYEIKKIYKEYKLIIIGEGEEKIKLQKIIKQLKLNNDVFLLGFKKNIFNYINFADCLISTALWEDPGFTLVETGILNKLVISSDCPSGPVELFNQNNGYLFKSNSKEDLVKQFIEYKNTSLEEKRKKIIITKIKFKKYSLFNHFLKIKSFLL
jgi:glycosyltransferase involved in cell wall biosynthesis